MGLFDFLRSKKRRKKKAAGGEAENTMRLDGVDLAGVEPTETRYTQEYQDYLAQQEAERKPEAPAGEERSTASEPPAAEEAAIAVEQPVAEEPPVAEEEPAEAEQYVGEGYPVVSPESVCAQFDRSDGSLIEEPEICETCAFFSEGDSTCRRPEQAQ